MYHIMLHATDLSDNHFYLCEQAVAFAKKFHATLHFIHVIEPPPSLQLAQGLGFAEFDRPQLLQEDAKAVMATLGDTFHLPPTQQWVEIGSIQQHVLAKIKELNADLLILGHHVSTHLPSFLDSSAHNMAEKSPCSVLILYP